MISALVLGAGSAQIVDFNYTPSNANFAVICADGSKHASAEVFGPDSDRFARFAGDAIFRPQR